MEKAKLTIYLSFIINSFILQREDSFTNPGLIMVCNISLT